MYEITVETEFCAAHSLSVGGAREPVHGHNWKVRVAIAGETLDSDGLLCDFHTVERTLRQLVAPLNNTSLDTSEAFAGVNPTAERVAEHIGRHLAEALDGPLAPHARVAWVSVTEAPGCRATWRA